MQARLEGKDDEEANEIALPPIPLEDIRDLALASSRSTVRECGVTHIRQGRSLVLLSAFSACSASALCRARARCHNALPHTWGVSSSTSGNARMPCAGGGWSSACMARSAMASCGSSAKVNRCLPLHCSHRGHFEHSQANWTQRLSI